MKKFLFLSFTLFIFIFFVLSCSKQTNGSKEPHFAIYMAEISKDYKQNAEGLKEVKMPTYINPSSSSFVVVAEGEKIYAGVFWSMKNSMRLPTGLPSIWEADKDGNISISFTGDNTDMRSDKRIKTALRNADKLK